MKKKFLVVLLLVGVFLLGGCTNNKSITAEEFKNIMEKKGYTVTDVTSQYYEYPHMKKVYVAENKDKTYQLDFCEIESNEMAAKVFESNKSTIDEVAGNNVKERVYKNNKNVSYYKVIDSYSYMAVIRKNNTLIYVDEDVDYKAEIDELLKSIGY